MPLPNFGLCIAASLQRRQCGKRGHTLPGDSSQHQQWLSQFKRLYSDMWKAWVGFEYSLFKDKIKVEFGEDWDRK